ncbi:uncharacterized protein LOC124460391 [Drosophila willistoni]|uniref:uncharacterized protein LOC124460391 n=1 Tax=Drosophila willistoni TaxID=7260 RepID=UPI001F0811DF|nr:uncharacterized protein LOC124460391 [Drosophila willistoni]
MQYLKLLTVLLCLFQVEGKFQKLNCEVFKTSFGEFKECEIKAVSRSKNLINIQYIFKDSLNPSYVQLYFLKRGNGYGWQPFLYNIKFDFCDFLIKRQPFMANLIYSYIKSYANFNNTCPQPGSLVKLTNFDLNVDTLRERFPIEQGEYGLVVNWFTKNKKMFSINGSILYSDYKV